MKRENSLTDQELADFDSDETHDECSVHFHFEKTGFRYWCDISSEGERMLSLIGGEPISYSTQCVIAGIAAQCSNGVISAFAEALGIPKKIAEYAIFNWLEDFRRGPVTLEEFIAIGQSDYDDVENITKVVSA